MKALNRRLIQEKQPTVRGLTKAGKNMALFLIFSAFSLSVAVCDYRTMISMWGTQALAKHYQSQRAPQPLPMPYEGDFANLWLAGRLARANDIAVLYQPRQIAQYHDRFFHHPVATPPWLYPPLAFLPGFLFSFLPLRIAFWFWNIGTIIIAAILLRLARLTWISIGLGILGPASMASIMLGQYGTLVGAATVATLLLSRKEPLLSGSALALTAFKPQTALVVPVAFVLQSQWKALAYAIGIGLILLALDVILFGIHPWWLYLTKGLAESRAVLDYRWPQSNEMSGTSFFWMFRSFGSGVLTSEAAQLTASTIVILAMSYLIWRCRSTSLTTDSVIPYAAMVCSASLLVSPYGYSMDMVSCSVCCAMLMAQRRKLTINDPMLWIWLWPGVAPIMSHITGVLLTPLVLFIMFLLSARSLSLSTGKSIAITAQTQQPSLPKRHWRLTQ